MLTYSMPMTGYTKLFGSIVASTIWREDNDTRIVWITMLALSNRMGVVESSVPGLADLARVSVDKTRKALIKLESPDPDSRSKEEEGRRIRTVDGGWLIVNHAKYRAKLGVDERREYNRIKQQEHRVNKRKQMSALSAHTEAEAEAEAGTLSRRVIERVKDFVPPTVEEVRLLCEKAGLPATEAEVIWNFYESKGWMVGRSKMKNAAAAVGGWAARKRGGSEGAISNATKPTASETFVRTEELRRVEAKMKSISGSYSEHQSWAPEDINKFKELRERKRMLVKLLGMQA